MKKKFNNTEKNKKLIKVLVVIAVIFVSAMFVGEAFQGAINTLGTTPSTQSNTQPDAQGNVFSTPTYTNGTYKVAEVGNINHLSLFSATSVCDFELLDEIYDTPYNFFPNETVGPWLATGVTGYSVAGHNITTVDPLNGTKMNVNYIYTLHIRSGVKWQDWTSANAGDTYSYPLTQTFLGTNGKPADVNNTIIYDTAVGHNITVATKNLTMQTYDVQSADFILSWEILFESEDFEGEYPSIVNIVPVNNLTVEYYLSTPVPISLFKETALDTPIMPYNVWDSHAYSSISGLWNYSATLPSSGAYNTWNLGYNPSTGYAPGLVGSGPYMMYAGFGMPKGAWISSDYWQLYVNPDYFVQYVPSLSQFTPKVYSIYAAIYTSDSAAVASLSDGQTYAMLNALPATFIPTVKGIPSSYIYDKAGTGYGYQQVSSYAANAPFNITDLRVALEYAIPKTYLASVVAEGYSIPGPDTPVPDSDILWQASGVPYYHFDLAKAKSYIDDAIHATKGMPSANVLSYSRTTPGVLSGTTLYYGGKPVTQTIQITSASEDPLGVEGANKIATYWTDLGISTTVKEESFSTLLANLVAQSPTNPTAFQEIDLGLSDIVLNPADDLSAFENSYLGAGTGFYLGPFTTFNYTSGPSFAVNLTTGNISTSSTVISGNPAAFSPNMSLVHDKTYSGAYVTNFLNKLVNESYVETNASAEHVILDVLQYVLADQATLQNLGYTVDPMAIVNSTFTGIDHDSLGLTGFWYWNFMDIHLKKPVIVTKPVTLPYQLEVGVISNSKIYYSGQYGNLTIQVRNQYGQAMPNVPVSVGYIASDGGIVNITSVSGKTNSNGIYHFEFQVTTKNEAIYTSDYAGDVQFTVTAIAPSSSYVSGKGSLNVDIEPYAVAYKIVKYPDYISAANNTTSKTTTMLELEVYNPLTGKAISGYQYTAESLSGLVQLVASDNQVLADTTNPYMSVNSTGIFHDYTNDMGDGMLYLNGSLYIADMGTNNVTVLGATGSMHNITVGNNPMQLAYDKKNNTIYVTNAGSNNVTVINAKTMATISNIAVGKTPVGIAYDYSNNTMYVANSGSNTVSIIAAGTYNVSKPVTINNVTSTYTLELTGKVIKTLTVGTKPMELSYFAGNNTMYVANYGSSNVTAIRQMNTTVINETATIDTYGLNPEGMAMNATSLFIANAGSDNISIVNMAKNTYDTNLTLENATGVPLLNGPMGLNYSKGMLYATDGAANNVTMIDVSSAIADRDATSGIINTTKYPAVFKNIMVGSMPMNIEAISTNLVVTNYMSGNITVVNLTTYKTTSLNVVGLNVTKILPVPDYNMTKITGTTGTSGDINILMEYNSSFSWALNDITNGFAHTYIFMGDYSSAAPMPGETTYMDLGQVTSSMNPSGFGVIQPFEIPVMVNETPIDGVHISVSYKGTITNNGTEMMTLTATQDGKPLSNYNITVTAQNALGANRGLVYGTSTLGTTSATDPNSAFGSTSMPEYTVTTNSAGVAYVNFTASEYTYNSTYAYKLVPFSSTHLVPYDEFQLGIMGMNATGAEYSAATSIVSTPFEFNNTTNPYIFPTATVYLLGASYSNGSYFILSDHKYTMYINSTYNTAAGPSYKDLSFTASTNYGHISVSKGSTGSSGSYKLTYTSKPVTTITKITVTLTLAGSGQKEAYTFYVLPHKAPSYTLYYAIIGVVAVIAAIFIAMYAISMRKLKAAKK